MEWLNEPPLWQANGEVLAVAAGPHTDFWRKTYDGGVRDSGHFYHRTVTGDFSAEVKVSGAYAALYDQAGMMVRLNEATWLKCGIEYLDGVQQASVVVTRDYSDWSVLPLANPPAIWVRVTRHQATLEVRYSLDGATYTLIRQAYLTEAPALQVGLMLAAPSGEGFRAVFEGFKISA